MNASKTKTCLLVSLLTALAACDLRDTGNKKSVTFRVTAESLPADARIFIAGNRTEGIELANATLAVQRDTVITIHVAGWRDLGHVKTILSKERFRNKVEEMSLKGMPLGGFSEFPYQIKKIDLDTGDTVLLMSDGFPEMFNENREMLDYDRARRLLREVGAKSPQSIIAHFTQVAERWAGARPHDDDMSFVVLQAKNDRRDDRDGKFARQARREEELSIA